MATLDPKRNPTLRDIQLGKVDGEFDKDIVDLALEANPIMGHFVWKTANNGTNDVTTIRTGYPEGTWTLYYEGVQPTKGTKKQVVNSCGTLKHLIQVDKDLIEESGDEAAEMGDEAFAHAEAMGNEICETVFYGNTKKNGRKFNGLAPIYSEKYVAGTSTKDVAAYYTLAAKQSNSADNSALRSIWLIGHGRMGTYLFAPKNTTMGLWRGPVEDNRIDVIDGSGANKGRLDVKEQMFKWTCGLTVKDFRKNVRICNIELNNLDTLDLDLGALMLQAVCRAQKTGVRQCFYMSPLTYEYVCKKTRAQKLANGFFDFRDFDGELVLHFQNVPVFQLDALETNEDVVA